MKTAGIVLIVKLLSLKHKSRSSLFVVFETYTEKPRNRLVYPFEGSNIKKIFILIRYSPYKKCKLISHLNKFFLITEKNGLSILKHCPESVSEQIGESFVICEL